MSALFGSKPKIPALAVTTLGQSQQQAIKDNTAAEAGAAQIANFTKDQIISMMNSVIPGYSNMTSTASSNIASELKGEIPTDVSQAVQNRAVARSLGTGTAGSGMNRDLVARDLGLTSLELTSKGLADTESWMSASEKMLAPAMSEYMSMFVNPTQEYQVTNEQNVQQFQRQWMQNQINAMPDPIVRGIQDTFMQLSGRGGQPSSNYGAGLGTVGTDANASSPGWDGWSGDAYGASIGTMPEGGFGTIEGAGEGTGEGAAMMAADL